MDDAGLSGMRVEYGSAERDASADLDVDALADGWVALLLRWIADAAAAGSTEPNAMVLATVDDGRPVTRSVLCKSVDAAGVTFYTNYDSDKGRQLAEVPYASATFPWYRLSRQAHVRGAVHKVSREDTEAYWAARPRGAQLGAWASQQSRPIASREELLARVVEVEARFADQEPIPAPPHWGGYRIVPEVVEFWQGRRDRVHNRIRAHADGRVERLQP
ncbi:pyridoxamine 5'-phosphate oxidase [Mycolicibacterium brumae]|nr:hypothetical protein MBRU_02240 [Mycolicibacterium brumae DSM 44177]